MRKRKPEKEEERLATQPASAKIRKLKKWNFFKDYEKNSWKTKAKSENSFLGKNIYKLNSFG